MRRGRIVASICAFVLCLGALVAGIYAAVSSANFTLTPSVNFNTKGVYVDIEGRVLRGEDFGNLKAISEDASHTLSKQKNYVADESGNPSGNKTVGTWSPKNVWFLGAEPIVSFELTITNHSLEPISVIPGEVTNLPSGVTLYEDTAATLYVESEETKTLRMNYKLSDSASAFTAATIDMSFDFVPTSSITNSQSDFTVSSTTLTGINSGYSNPVYGQRVVVVPSNIRINTVGSNGLSFSSTTKYLILPKGLINLNESACWNNEGIVSIYIPSGVTTIGYSGFEYCSSLTSITMPSSVTSIEGQAFQDCSSLTSINIPNGVTIIGFETFSNCQLLTSIEIPEGVTTIDDEAFAGCNSLTSIVIPSSVTYIGMSAFSYCSSLKSVYMKKLAPEIYASAFGYSSSAPYTNSSFKIYVKSENISGYQPTTGYSTSVSSVNNWYYYQDKLTTY